MAVEELIPRSRSLLESTISFAAGEDTGCPHLLVFHDGSMSVAPLSRDGSYVIGRGGEADIPLEDPSISRKQATVHVCGEDASVEDLGSHNGTRVNGRSILEKTPLSSGDVIGFGQTQLVFCRTTQTPKASALQPFDDFARRAHEEAERSLRYLRPFAILLLGGGDRGSDDELLVESILRAVRTIDVVARIDERVIAILLVEYSPGAEEGVLRAALRVDKKLRAGLARWPDDSAASEPLIDAARAAWERAQPGRLAAAPEAEHRVKVGDRELVFVEPAMIQLYSLVERLAKVDSPVLISGETGCGKEVVARAIHELSPRKDKRFVAVSGAALTEQSVETELFAQLEAAQGGTLFLDEIGDLSLAVQAKLLRALEERKIRRTGDSVERDVDVRIIAATNRDLPKAKEAGTFRSDLFYRFNVTTLLVPPLRRRPRDIPALARHFVRELSAQQGRPEPALQPAALRVLSTYEWPGNVRELRNALERSLALAQESLIEPWMLPLELGPLDEKDEKNAAAKNPFQPLDEEIRELERRRIEQALDHTGGVQTKAAALLSVPLRTFYMKVKQYGIDASRRPPRAT